MDQPNNSNHTNQSIKIKKDHQNKPYVRFVVSEKSENDPRSNKLLQDAHALGINSVSKIKCSDIYFIEGKLSNDTILKLKEQVLFDPVTQEIEYETIDSTRNSSLDLDKNIVIIETALLPGVTDAVAKQIIRASKIIGLKDVNNVATGNRYLIEVNTPDIESLNFIAKKLLCNPIVQRYTINTIDPVFPKPPESTGNIEKINIRDMSDEKLMELSKNRLSALDIYEMRAIQKYYISIDRDMTDIEFEMIAQTWSEHCVHKTFSALIEYEDEDGNKTVIDNLLKTYIRAATEEINAQWVLSAFVDNAGIIEFDDRNEISFKVETHNHPSAIEPFGGANTGIGGVIRDVIGVSAKPIAATDVLCFGPQDIEYDQLQDNILHPRRIQSGVVSGIEDYGNKIGIPTVNGAVLYDNAYTANPLVFCGCVGIAPKGSHPCNPKSGDHLIILGGRTGRDGLRGATFSSMTMDAKTGEVSGASVQIGAPITEKGLIDVITKARDLNIYTAITDCGAGGLSSAIGEMTKDHGSEVELGNVQLKYPGLAPWEIWLSEAQERMILAVPEEQLYKLEKLCEIHEVELTDAGKITNTGKQKILYKDQVVLELSNEFLHKGIPQKKLIAKKDQSHNLDVKDYDQSNDINYEDILLKLLSHPNIASKESIIRVYDHEVMGGTIVKPTTGIFMDGPSDGCVLKPIHTSGKNGVILTNGINAEFGKIDPYRMALSVIDEAIRNCIAVGGDPDRIAILDNFCWGDPKNPQTLASLVDAARGCYDAATYFKTPFISGKDSLNNEFIGKDGLSYAIPPTLLISAIGIIDDITKAMTMDLKTSGNPVYLLGEISPHFAGSHFSKICNHKIIKTYYDVPEIPIYSKDLYRKLYQANKKGLVLSCHDCSEGGLSITSAEMCIGGRKGMLLDLQSKDPIIDLFSENNGCLLVEIDNNQTAEFEKIFRNLPFKRIGQVTDNPHLIFTNYDHTIIDLSIDTLIKFWKK